MGNRQPIIGFALNAAEPKASKAAARVRSAIAKKKTKKKKKKKKHSPAPAADATTGKGVPPAVVAIPTSAAPALSRAIRRFAADAQTEAHIGRWKTTHIAEKVAKFDNTLARSTVVAVFEQLDADIIDTKALGSIARVHRRGEIDYKALAIAELGAAKVTQIEESYRKPSSNPPTAPNAWSAEAGLPND